MKKNFIDFFKTSPLSARKIIAISLIGALFFLALIICGIYLAITEPKNFGYLWPCAISGLVFATTLYNINTPRVEEWLGLNKGWSGGEDYSWMKSDTDLDKE